MIRMAVIVAVFLYTPLLLLQGRRFVDTITIVILERVRVSMLQTPYPESIVSMAIASLRPSCRPVRDIVTLFATMAES